MTITLPLQPREEARLIAAAQAKGVSTEALVREALDKFWLIRQIELRNKKPIGARSGA